MKTDYLCEHRLQKLDPKLHQLFKDSVFSLQQLLTRYKNIFPTYTDHTALHSLEVVDFCNALIGEENIDKLNADEIYILLMSCYLHDSGMGITESDFELFRQKIDFGNYFETHKDVTTPDLIRDFHHEFSGLYIKKYADFFDIPSQEHVFSIAQVSRGHRKTDLYDEKEYPAEYKLPNGNTVCLPYLAALIRLADELDIAADRNLQFIYDINKIDNEISRMEFKKHEAIRHLDINEDSFMMHVDASDADVYEGVKTLGGKLDSTLQYCIDVVDKRTPYEIQQKSITIKPIGE
ncbi:MAG: hypothetical protein ACI4E1_00070 [Lachnospira sp.]